MTADTTTSAPSDADQAGLTDQLTELARGAERWAATGLSDRAALLRMVHASVGAASNRWAQTAAGLKRLEAMSSLVGEEWLSGPYALLGATDRLARTLDALAEGRSPVAGLRFHPAPGGRTAVDILPLAAADRLLLNGFSGQVWFPPGVTADTVRTQAGMGAKRSGESGGVGLVLGAGNITAIPPLDVLYELVAHNRAVILKLNPVMAAMMTSYLDALDPLVRFGVLRIVQGGAEVGSFLAQHAGVQHVHITGSAVSHDAVVFGTGTDGAQRRAAGRPRLTKPITSELGGVSPVIVVPGAWTAADLKFQAEHVATQRLHNGGYNCIASQVVIVSRDWPAKDAFLAELRAAMDAAPRRAAWYPGSADRSRTAADAYPAAVRLGPDQDRLLIRVDADDAEALAGTEYFAPVLGVLEVPGSGQDFLDAAVRLANDELAGTLGANVVIRPADRRALGTGFDDAIAALRYGTIAINAWTALGFLTAAAPWGAFPGSSITDVGSGLGIVHNALLLAGPERTVVQGPFRPFPRSVLAGERAFSPKPPWFVNARTAATTGRLMTDFAARPSLRRLPGIVISAFRG